jgi:hypothetical protein
MKSGRPLVSQPAQNNEPQAHFAKVGVQVKDLLARPLKVSHDPAVFPSKASHLNTKQDRCHFGRVRLTCAGGQWPRQTNAPESPKPLVSCDRKWERFNLPETNLSRSVTKWGAVHTGWQLCDSFKCSRALDWIRYSDAQATEWLWTLFYWKLAVHNPMTDPGFAGVAIGWYASYGLKSEITSVMSARRFS